MRGMTFLFLLSLMAIPCTGGVIYVDDDASPGGNGTTWGTAYKYLQDALHEPPSYGDEIWVAAGMYKPDQDEGGNVTTGDREATFQVVNGVSLYGGFAGGESRKDARNLVINRTTLSGDLSGNDGPDFANNGENSYIVATCSGADANTIIDGFTIIGGNANGLPQEGHARGAGMRIDSGGPTVSNCTFKSNRADHGAGMYISQSNPTITDCIFVGNRVDGQGSGMYNSESTTVVSNCIFRSNLAWGSGGGMNNYESNPTIINCMFYDNEAVNGQGGAIRNWDNNNAEVTNCTFSGNSAVNGNCIACDSFEHGAYPNTVEINNCILWDGGDEVYNNDGSSITITYSCVQDEEPKDGSIYPGTGNIDADPNFVTGPLGDYYLSQTAAGQDSNSPCVDAGSDTAENLGMDKYMTRTDKVADEGLVDMGYHYPDNIADLNDDGYVNSDDVLIMALQWLDTPGIPSADIAPAPNGDNFVDYLDFGMVQQSWRWP